MNCFANDNIFESSFNYLIANDFKQANQTFLANYYKHPDEINFLYGVIISFILLKNIKGSIDFLEKEAQISPLRNKINLIVNFIKINDYFNNMKQVSILFNIGLFLKKSGLHNDPIVFFRMCLILAPNDKKILTVLGEYAIIENNISKGINLFTQAAKVSF